MQTKFFSVSYRRYFILTYLFGFLIFFLALCGRFLLFQPGNVVFASYPPITSTEATYFVR